MHYALLKIQATTGEALHELCTLAEIKPEPMLEIGVSGGPATRYAMMLKVAEADNTGSMLYQFRDFVAKCQAGGGTFEALGVTGDVTLRITVGGKGQPGASLDFMPSDLLSIARLGINVSIDARAAGSK
ncbi:MAG TPA: hypothetical protein VFT37_07130 [Telluria sp.]|nr:hypothetical protein [Telluria sp.]